MQTMVFNVQKTKKYKKQKKNKKIQLISLKTIFKTSIYHGTFVVFLTLKVCPSTTEPNFIFGTDRSIVFW